MFIIPFFFAMYPELLLIEPAILNPAATGADDKYLLGYNGQFYFGALVWLIARLIVALYLLASALAA